MTVQLAGFYLDDAGAAVSGATVNIYARNTTTPAIGAGDTTDSSGYWQVTGLAEGRYDVEIVDGSIKRRIKYDDEIQLERIDVASLQIRNPADTFTYDIVPGAISANRTLNLPVITGTDTLAVLGLAQTFTAIQSYGAGGIIRFSAGTAVTAAQYEFVRDTDATNQMHWNVPTGATYEWSTNDVSQMVFGAGILYVGDTSDVDVTVGLVLNQGAADDQIFALKSSDVAHGMTALAETDTYLSVAKSQAGSGGVNLIGYQDADAASNVPAFLIQGILGVAGDTTHSASGRAAVELQGGTKSGTGATTVGAGGNIVAFRNYGNTRFIFDGDGTSYEDVGTAWTNYDEYDDMVLLTSLASHLALPGNEIEASFSRWATANREELQARNIVVFNRDGHHFLNTSKHAMLLNGAIRQLGQRLFAAENEIADLRRILSAA